MATGNVSPWNVPRDVTHVETGSLLAQLIEAAAGNVQPGAIDTAPIAALLEQGCDLDLDVLPVVLTAPKIEIEMSPLLSGSRCSLDGSRSPPGLDGRVSYAPSFRQIVASR